MKVEVEGARSRMDRAFSPHRSGGSKSWGDAPGWYGAGPLALRPEWGQTLCAKGYSRHPGKAEPNCKSGHFRYSSRCPGLPSRISRIRQIPSPAVHSAIEVSIDIHRHAGPSTSGIYGRTAMHPPLYPLRPRGSLNRRTFLAGPVSREVTPAWWRARFQALGHAGAGRPGAPLRARASDVIESDRPGLPTA